MLNNWFSGNTRNSSLNPISFTALSDNTERSPDSPPITDWSDNPMGFIVIRYLYERGTPNLDYWAIMRHYLVFHTILLVYSGTLYFNKDRDPLDPGGPFLACYKSMKVVVLKATTSTTTASSAQTSTNSFVLTLPVCCFFFRGQKRPALVSSKNWVWNSCGGGQSSSLKKEVRNARFLLQHLNKVEQEGAFCIFGSLKGQLKWLFSLV